MKNESQKKLEFRDEIKMRFEFVIIYFLFFIIIYWFIKFIKFYFIANLTHKIPQELSKGYGLH